MMNFNLSNSQQENKIQKQPRNKLKILLLFCKTKVEKKRKL